ncbi:thiamine pyrophosphate-binding protein [Saccharopolyspora shandongensis]|uniref:thiamine pyrophosphate-binding protein n=1 Tax=Saccharopolyspora shandongensis TaxID=418495 RepID=UPI0033C9F548
MNVAEVVGRTVAALGADHVFGVVGSGNFHVTNALVTAGARFVAARHEGGAATMADAYARTSGRVGVLSVHQGCGLTNALTGITEAAKSRTPLLVLAAETASAAIRSNFRIDQAALATAVGARAERVHSAATAVDDVVRAFRLATEGRRTVVLNLPLDVQAAEFDGEPHVPQLLPLNPVAPSAVAVRELADRLVAAQRPVFIAGRGARHAGAELRALAEDCGALLATSAVARGLFHDDPWSLDVSGGFATPLAAELISGADLIVGWGTALNMWTTRHGNLIGPGSALVQVDVESEAIGAHRPVDLGVLGDVAATAEAARAELTDRGTRLAGYRDPEVRERIASAGSWRDVAFADESTSDAIDPRALTIALDALLPEERVLAVDSGNFMGYPSMFLRVPDEQGFCFTQAFQSIGLGLATAIGAALARPDRLPVAALGDGGALMGVAELETAARLGLPMVIVVYNDHAYGAEVHHFGPDGHRLDTVEFPDTDLAAAARGFGCTGLTVRSEADLAPVRDWLTGPRATPLLIDAKIAPSEGAWWLVEAFRGH